MSDAPEAEPVRWKKSSRSASAGNCVETATIGDRIAVRDSKDPDGSWLMFNRETWRDFVADICAGSFDRPAGS